MSGRYSMAFRKFFSEQTLRKGTAKLFTDLKQPRQHVLLTESTLGNFFYKNEDLTLWGVVFVSV